MRGRNPIPVTLGTCRAGPMDRVGRVRRRSVLWCELPSPPTPLPQAGEGRLSRQVIASTGNIRDIPVKPVELLAFSCRLPQRGQLPAGFFHAAADNLEVRREKRLREEKAFPRAAPAGSSDLGGLSRPGQSGTWVKMVL